jgi:hypothetical protein
MSTSIPIGSLYVGTGGVASCSSAAAATSATAARRVAAVRTSGSEPSSGGAQGRSGESSRPMVRSPMNGTMQCPVWAEAEPSRRLCERVIARRYGVSPTGTLCVKGGRQTWVWARAMDLGWRWA